MQFGVGHPAKWASHDLAAADDGLARWLHVLIIRLYLYYIMAERGDSMRTPDTRFSVYNGLALRTVSGPVVWNPQLTADEIREQLFPNGVHVLKIPQPTQVATLSLGKYKSIVPYECKYIVLSSWLSPFCSISCERYYPPPSNRSFRMRR